MLYREERALDEQCPSLLPVLTPAAGPWTMSATQDLDKRPKAALGISKHSKSRPEIYLCSPTSFLPQQL